MPGKTSLRDKLDEDVLDLSLMQLNEVPVTEIAQLPKGTTLDLSNNHLVYLPENFPTLTHIVKLDLSKNRLEELPEFFGQLKNLRHLDLYSNQLERLPVSFSQLKNLKWLDLKNNPLVPALQQAAGPCITPADCTLCSKKVVALLQSMQSQMERERQRLAIEEQKADEQRRILEEQEKEKIRNEKRAAKERRREARAKEDFKKQQDRMTTSSSMSKEPINGRGMKNGSGDSAHHYNDYQANKGFEYKDYKGMNDTVGWCRSLMMLMLAILLVSVGSGISLLFIYTGGNLDQRSIERALPILQQDVENTMIQIGQKVDHGWHDAQKTLNPILKKISKNGLWLWEELLKNGAIVWNELEQKTSQFLHYAYVNWGPTFNSACDWCQIRFNELMKYASQLWDLSKPYIDHFVSLLVHYSGILAEKLKQHFPILIDTISTQASYLWTSASTSFNKFIGEN